MKNLKFISLGLIVALLFACSINANKETSFSFDAATLLSQARQAEGDQNATFTINVTLTRQSGETLTKTVNSKNESDIPTEKITFDNLMPGEKVSVNAEILKDEVLCFVADKIEIQVKQGTQSEKLPLKRVIDTTVPGGVSNLSSSLSGTSVTFVWTNPTDKDLKNIEIEYGIMGSPVEPTILQLGITTSTQISNLLNNSIYSFKFYTVDTSGNKSESVVFQQVLGNPPIIFEAIKTADIVKDKKDVTLAVPAIYGVDKVVYAKDSVLSVEELLASESVSNAIKMPSVVPGTDIWMFSVSENGMYTIAMQGINGIIDSKVVEISEIDKEAPRLVTDLQAQVPNAEGTVILSWTNPTDDDFWGVIISISGSDGSEIQDITVDCRNGQPSKQVIAGLINDVEYTFEVRSVDAIGNISEEVAFVTETPLSPLSLSYSLNNVPTNKAVPITIEVSSSVSVSVYYGAGLDLSDYKNWTMATQGETGGIYTFSVTENGTYSVVAVDSIGREANISIDVFNIDTTPPSPVTNLRATVGYEYIKFTWDNPTDADFAGISMKMTNDDKGLRSTKITPINEVEIKNYLTNGKTYSIDIVASDTVGNKSETVSMEAIPTEMVLVEGNADINSFYIGATEITQKQYENVIDVNPSKFQGTNFLPASGESKDKRPVEWVSWYDAIVYCNARSMAEGYTPCYEIKGATDPSNWGTVPTSEDDDWEAVICNPDANGYRLPTLAEWNWAASGGTKSQGLSYSGSDTIDEVAWYSGNSSNISHQVKLKAANELELFDMSGNVYEWCWDVTSSTGGIKRAKRGGSYYGAESVSKLSAETRDDSSFTKDDVTGFRVVRSTNVTTN